MTAAVPQTMISRRPITSSPQFMPSQSLYSLVPNRRVWRPFRITRLRLESWTDRVPLSQRPHLLSSVLLALLPGPVFRRSSCLSQDGSELAARMGARGGGRLLKSGREGTPHDHKLHPYQGRTTSARRHGQGNRVRKSLVTSVGQQTQ